jgi:putative Mg2+ transporter-C (MgtC) family protein
MISPEVTILRLAVAAVLGGLVGLERERLEWAAGMRTHALVSLGSALFMVVSIFGFSDILNEQHVILDPSRVTAQVASGIGFIGAGTIILRREVVKGLTTAASIWAVAAVGLAVGGGMFLAAGAATLLALALLVLAKPLKARMFPNRKDARRVRLIVERGTPLAKLRDEIEAAEVPLERIVVRPGSAAEEDDAELVLAKGSRGEELLGLIDGQRRVPGVREVNSTPTVQPSRSLSGSPDDSLFTLVRERGILGSRSPRLSVRPCSCRLSGGSSDTSSRLVPFDLRG